MYRYVLAALAALCAAPAGAHDSWLDPQFFHVSAGTPVPLGFVVGHGSERAPASLVPRPSWAVSMISLGPDGAKQERLELGSSTAGPGTVTLDSRGVHVIALASSHFRNELPADEFTAYLKDEGLTLALRSREETGRTDARGREVYNRIAKTLIEVGPPSASAGAAATTPLGLSLEIVPGQNPYAADRRDRLPVRIFYHGRPLSGALVTLNDLESGAWPTSSMRTDRRGRVAFKVPRSGRWMLNVVWSRPLADYPHGDFETTFSSLTFGYEAEASADHAKR